MKNITVLSISFFLLLSIPLVQLQAQEKLSRKEQRELRKQEKMEALYEGLVNASFYFTSDKIATPTGKPVYAKGGLMEVKKDVGQLMKFTTVDRNDNQKILTQSSTVENYVLFGDFNEGTVVVSFNLNFDKERWSVRLTVQKNGDSVMGIKASSGLYTSYEGKSKALQ